MKPSEAVTSFYSMASQAPDEDIIDSEGLPEAPPPREGLDEYGRHPDAYPAGGLCLRDEDNTRAVIVDFLKRIGQKLAQGSFIDIMKISRPARISHGSSYLEAVARDWQFAPSFLSRAAACSDPVERLRYVVAFGVAGVHMNPMVCKTKAPLNPILGETLQGSFSDGTKFYAEQTSHHPPVSHWQIMGPDGLYHFHGYGELNAQIRLNKVKGWRVGKSFIDFRDGSRIEMTDPEMRIYGIMYGARTVDIVKTMNFWDHANRLGAEVQFKPDDPSMLHSLAGAVTNTVSNTLTSLGRWWSGSNQKAQEDKPKGPPSDLFKVEIFQFNPQDPSQRVVIARGQGSWLGYLEFDGRRLWNIMDEPEPLIFDEDALPSDSRFRQDLQLIKQKDYTAAQPAKDELEELQRHDARLRKRQQPDASPTATNNAGANFDAYQYQ